MLAFKLMLCWDRSGEGDTIFCMLERSKLLWSEDKLWHCSFQKWVLKHITFSTVYLKWDFDTTSVEILTPCPLPLDLDGLLGLGKVRHLLLRLGHQMWYCFCLFFGETLALGIHSPCYQKNQWTHGGALVEEKWGLWPCLSALSQTALTFQVCEWANL